jgi:Zn-dependent protease with chaperone function
MKAGAKLPEWTEEAGGRAAWQEWLNRRVTTCVRRAADWAAKRRRIVDNLPTPPQWREAIALAMATSQGLGYYSKLPLSLAPPLKSTHWNWPSVDHIRGPGVAEVVLETRLVNDMKTIMSKDEFLAVVGHIAAVHAVTAAELPKGWSCRRAFAVEEQPDEPPLPA